MWLSAGTATSGHRQAAVSGLIKQPAGLQGLRFDAPMPLLTWRGAMREMPPRECKAGWPTGSSSRSEIRRSAACADDSAGMTLECAYELLHLRS